MNMDKRKRILFIKQSPLQNRLLHMEQHIETAFARNANVDFFIFDCIDGVKCTRDKGTACTALFQEYTIFIIQAILEFKPDAVLIMNGYLLDLLFPSFFSMLEQKGIPIVAWHSDDPHCIDLQELTAPYCDFIFTSEMAAVPLWKEYGSRVYHLPFACSVDGIPVLDGYKDISDYTSDICFIGIPFSASKRVQVIDTNAEFLGRYDTKICGTGTIDSWRQNLKNYDLLKKKVHDRFIDPFKAQIYASNAKISLNLHRDSFGHVWDRNKRSVQAQSPNEWFFSLASIGSFQIMDNSRPQIRQLFPRDLITEFDSDESFRQQIDYYLTHENERKEKALALQKIVHENHTYDHRVAFIVECLEKEL